MATPMDLARLLVRQAEEGADEPQTPACESGNEYDGRMGVRISAIFVIMIGSMLGESV
jgi:zinc transporter 1/2/3